MFCFVFALVVVGLPLAGEKPSHSGTSSFLPASGKMQQYHSLMTIIAVIITIAIYFFLSLCLSLSPRISDGDVHTR